MAPRYTTAELKAVTDNHEGRISTLETRTVEHAKDISFLRRDVDKTCKDFEDYKKDYEEWRDDVNKILTKTAGAIDFGKWLLIGFGGSVIALIWTLITGQATLIFK